MPLWHGPNPRAATPAASASSASAAAAARCGIYSGSSPNVKAGVAFYGPVVDPEGQKAIWPKSATDLAPDMKAAVLGLYGEADQGIPVPTVEALKAKLQAAGKKAEFKIYPGAPHGFHADYRPSYRKEAADDAWAQLTAWFKANGVLS
jgi:carboxymethylenebutenolidase